MTPGRERKKSVLMIAYTNYEIDPRVIRAAEAALEAGYSVDVLALRRTGNPSIEEVRGVRVFHLNQTKFRGSSLFKYLASYLGFFFRCFAKSAFLFFKHRYSVIHVNNMPDFLVFSTFIPRLLGAKVILDIHDPMPNTFASKFKAGEKGFYFKILLWQEKLSAAYSNLVITVHDPVKDGILVKHGLAPDSIGVVANFPDPEVFPLQTSYSIQGKPRFVFHGTILERSGLGMLMAAVSMARNKNRMHIKIIGEGDYSAKLQESIRSLKLEDVVEFDNHSYKVHSICEKISDCNVGLVPLMISSVTNYALPLKLLEYISMGLPVLTVRSYAISHYLSDQDCIFFECNDPASLAEAMDRIVENPEILLHYRERSLALRDRFTWPSEKAKYIEMLRQLSN